MKMVIKVFNNRAPEFNQDSYKLMNVSRSLPLDLDLLAVYPQFRILVQDIDRQVNGIFGESNVNINVIDDQLGLFDAMFEEAFNSSSEVCSQQGSQIEDFQTLPVKLVRLKPFPENIQSPYQITLQAKVK